MMEADEKRSNPNVIFREKVSQLIAVIEEREQLFDSLKKYQVSNDVRQLVNDLKNVLDEPLKLEIFDHIRPLVRPQHQQQYDKLAPSRSSRKLRVIRMRRRPNENLGFAVRGGFEHGIGVFVSLVETGSQAEQQGLRVGDEIKRVNGFTIAEAIHEEVLNLIKGKDVLELKVNNMGMLPIKGNPNDPVTWKYIERPEKSYQKGGNSDGKSGPEKHEEVKLFINMRGAPSLGCGIASGPKNFPGIFIDKVRPGTLAEDYGLEVGDQIIEVNGKSFLGITHNEAIVELKGNKELNMVILKGKGKPLLEQKEPLQSHQKVVTVETHRPKIEPVNIPSPPPPPPPAPHPPSVSEVKRKPSQELVGSEILEADEQAEEERRRWEAEQSSLLRRKEEEIRAAELKRLERQKEEEKMKKEELMRQLKEHAKRQEEEARRQEEQRQEELRQEEQRQMEEVRIREEQQKKTRMQKQQSDILAGRGAPSSTKKPTLLGAQSEGENIKEVLISKDLPLDIELEGGLGSPLGGKIVVGEVFYGGAVHKQGEIHRGDQILAINDKNLSDLSLKQATEILQKAEKDSGSVVKFKLIVSEFHNTDDEITYF
ncbi:hypothetical protein CHS0354_038675 [Potamilus streckersoni]|uniref:PDZ domain-containing protein n=1 Tax=Potamilus streckersoni TaxID=2493646 RepID=A0AAE0W8I3_9BIVA|nr:hypothetical protein CHS0354_038675 [Potamilus streckersoni]